MQGIKQGGRGEDDWAAVREVRHSEAPQFKLKCVDFHVGVSDFRMSSRSCIPVREQYSDTGVSLVRTTVRGSYQHLPCAVDMPVPVRC